MRKAGAKDYLSYSKQILKISTNKPISLEVFADDYINMVDQGKKINTWGKNVYVKVPVVNSRNKFTGKVIKELNSQKYKIKYNSRLYIKTNKKRVLAQINKKTKVIISFAGRAADTGKDPIPEFRKV